MRIIILTLLIMFGSLIAGSVFADNVVLLEPSIFESQAQADAAQQDFGTYVSRMFTLTIGIAAVLAVIQITIGGIMRMTKDSIQDQSDGKKRIQDALVGLLLALASVLILTTINPQLLNFDLSGMIDQAVQKSDSGSAQNTGGNNTTPVDPVAEITQRQELSDQGVPVCSSTGCGDKGICQTPTQTDCTNTAQLPDSAIQEIISLKQDCNCNVVVTGGAEPGHETHGPGIPKYDLRSNQSIKNYLAANDPNPTQTSLGPSYTVNGVEYVVERARPGRPEHVHACVGGC